jgi:hypothetical protein
MKEIFFFFFQLEIKVPLALVLNQRGVTRNLFARSIAASDESSRFRVHDSFGGW